MGSSGVPLARDLDSLDEYHLASSLLRRSPPLGRIGTFDLVVLATCVFSLASRARSQVSCGSPNESHAFCTPDAPWPAGRFPPRFSRNRAVAPVLMPSGMLSMPPRRFTCAGLSQFITDAVNAAPFSMTFTTAVFGRSLWRFEASLHDGSEAPSFISTQHDACASS